MDLAGVLYATLPPIDMVGHIDTITKFMVAPYRVSLWATASVPPTKVKF